MEVCIPHSCVICKSAANFRCSRCKIPSYCSPGCQWKDWPKHKFNCFPPMEGIEISREVMELISILDCGYRCTEGDKLFRSILGRLNGLRTPDQSEEVDREFQNTARLIVEAGEDWMAARHRDVIGCLLRRYDPTRLETSIDVCPESVTEHALVAYELGLENVKKMASECYEFRIVEHGYMRPEPIHIAAFLLSVRELDEIVAAILELSEGHEHRKKIEIVCDIGTSIRKQDHILREWPELYQHGAELARRIYPLWPHVAPTLNRCTEIIYTLGN